MWKKYKNFVIAGAAAASVAVACAVIYKYMQSPSKSTSSKKESTEKLAQKIENNAATASQQALEKLEEDKAKKLPQTPAHVAEKFVSQNKAFIQKAAPAWSKTAIVNGEIKQLSSQDFAGTPLVLVIKFFVLKRFTK